MHLIPASRDEVAFALDSSNKQHFAGEFGNCRRDSSSANTLDFNAQWAWRAECGTCRKAGSMRFGEVRKVSCGGEKRRGEEIRRGAEVTLR